VEGARRLILTSQVIESRPASGYQEDMSKKIALPVFILFAAINVLGFLHDGIPGIVDYLRHTNGMTVVLGVDLVIALSMVCTWMWRDARRQGKKPLGYVVLTVLLGSIGPLWYLLRRRGGTLEA
jgi:hypothetical protein